MERQRQKKANALILSLSVMFVLSITAITFVRMATVEGRVATYNIDRSTASLIADAGIDHAITSLRETFENDLVGVNQEWLYTTKREADGEDYMKAYKDATSTPKNDATAFADGANGAGVPIEKIYEVHPDYSTDVAKNTNHPSYRYATPIKNRNVSGQMEDEQHLYTLKIFDTTAQINLNSQINVDNPSDSTYPRHMATILNNLSKAIALRKPYSEDRPGDTVGPLKGLGAEIVQKRLSLGWFKSKMELVGTYGGVSITQDDLKYVWDYLTVHPYPSEMKKNTIYHNIKPAVSPSGETFSKDYRSPININSASWPVLVAVMAGLKKGTVEITFDDAKRLANKICIKRETPFAGWDAFYSFLYDQESVVDEGDPLINVSAAFAVGGTLDPNAYTKVEILKANFDPNVSLRRLNPDKPLYQEVNKTDLNYYTMEFCFFPFGIFEITSLGQVLDPDGSVFTSSKRYTVAKAFDVLRKTTQYDFEHGGRYADFDSRIVQVDENTGLHGFSSPNNMQKSDIVGDLNNYASENFGHVQPIALDDEVWSGFTGNYLFKANFNGQLIANTGSNVNLQSPGVTGITSKSISDLTNCLATPSATKAAAFGDLASDGVVFRDGETTGLCYSTNGNFPAISYANPSANNGTFMFWIKVGKNIPEEWRTVAYATCSEVAGMGIYRGIQMEVKIKVYASDTQTHNADIQVTRKFFSRGSASTVWPEADMANFLYQYVSCTANASLNKTSDTGLNEQEWYHVAIRWTNGTNLIDYCPIVMSGNFYGEDGVAIPGTLAETIKGTTTSIDKASAVVTDFDVIKPSMDDWDQNLLYVGAVKESSGVKSCSMTIDDIRVSSAYDFDPSDSEYKPSRFPLPANIASDLRYGIYRTKFMLPTMPDGSGIDCHLIFLHWTLRLWGGLGYKIIDDGDALWGEEPYKYPKKTWQKMWNEMTSSSKIRVVDEGEWRWWKWKKIPFNIGMLNATANLTRLKIYSWEEWRKVKGKWQKVEVRAKWMDDLIIPDYNGKKLWVEDVWKEVHDNIYDMSASDKKVWEILLIWYNNRYGSDPTDDADSAPPILKHDGIPTTDFDTGTPQIVQNAFNVDIEFPASDDTVTRIYRSPIVDDLTLAFHYEYRFYEYFDLGMYLN